MAAAATTPFLRTTSSANLREASVKAIGLYREFMRGAPVARISYEFDQYTDREMKDAIKRQFQKNLKVDDPHVVDLLVFKGRQDLEEMMMKWKTPMHLRQFLDQETHVQKTRPVSASLSPSRQESAPAQPPSDFLKRFLSGGKQ